MNPRNWQWLPRWLGGSGGRGVHLASGPSGTLDLRFAAGVAQSRMRRDAPDQLVVGYTRTMLAALLWQPSPARIGIIGLGGGSQAKFLYRHFPRAMIEALEINPEVLALRERFRVPANTAWIVKRALRTLIKAGDRRALAVIGAGRKAKVRVAGFTVSPARVKLGERIGLALEFDSTASSSQRLVVDYAIHYVKKSGSSAAKVFKWKEMTVAAGESVKLARSQVIKDFTTRKHYPGRHAVEVSINGETLASGHFELD